MTAPQIDELIRLMGKLIELIPAFLGLIATLLSLLGTIVLIVRQHLNKRDTDAKLAENTAVTQEVKAAAVESGVKAEAAFSEANNLNLKLQSMGIQTKPAEIPLGTDADHPVHVANHTPAE